MKAKWLALIFILFLSFKPAFSVYAEPVLISTETRTTHYQIEYEMNWLIKLIIRGMGFKFLNWEEFILEEGILKNGEQEKITMIRAYAGNISEPIIYLKDDDGTTEGFAQPLKTKTRFLKESVRQLLSAFNRLIYKDTEEDFEINLPNVFGDLEESQGNHGSMHCRFIKTKDAANGKYLIQILTFNSQKKKNGQINLWLNPTTKILESWKIKLKLNIRINLTKIP